MKHISLKQALRMKNGIFVYPDGKRFAVTTLLNGGTMNFNDFEKLEDAESEAKRLNREVIINMKIYFIKG